MNLVEAFREVAPVEGDAATRARRRDAVERIFEELGVLALETWTSMAKDDRSDVASEVLIRVMQNGPRGCRNGDPASDGAVRAYLRMSIKNGLRDLLRRRKNVDMPEEFEPIDPGPELSEVVGRREAQRLLERLEGELFEGLVAKIASTSRNGKALLETVGQLREIRDGRLTMDELTDSECVADADEKERSKVRNRLDQRFSRAFTRVHEAINACEGNGEFDAEKARGLKVVLESLRLRQ